MKFRKMFILPVVAFSSIVLSSCVYNTQKANPEAMPDIIPVSEEHNDPISGYCYVTFDANGTTFNEGAPVRAFQIRRGHTWKRIKNNPNMPDENGNCLDKEEMKPKVFQGWVTSDNKHLYDSFIFNEESVKITAKWGREYNPKEFVTDSWDTFIQVAEKGYDELMLKYRPSFEDAGLEGDALDTFIITDLTNPIEVMAKTRYVEIEGLVNPLQTLEGDRYKWPVRVIGENHDLIDGYNNKVAALTFQFSYAVNPAIAFNPFDERGYQNWETSTLRNYLNTTLLYQFDSELLSGIQTVNKNTDCGSKKGDIDGTGEKVFIPSVSEMLTEDKIGELEKPFFTYTENSLYDFYRYHLDNDYKKSNFDYLFTYNPFNLDSEGNPKQINAWLRSPFYGHYTYESDVGYVGTSEYIEEDNSFIYDMPTNAPLAVMPCFAVGEDDAYSVNIQGTNDVESYGINNFASNKEGYTAKMKMKYDSSYALPGKDNITVYINGTQIAKDAFDYENTSSEATLTIHNDAIPKEPSNGQISINIVPIENRFKSCSWEFLTETANKGWEALITEFDRTSFIGEEKFLTVNGVKYRVRVVQDYDPEIDEEGEIIKPSDNADDLVAGGKAPLTFEFVTVADNSSVVYDETTATNFPNSYLQSYLNEWGDKLDEATGGVAPVIKLVNDYNNQAFRWTAIPYETKAFATSLTEMGQGSTGQDDSEGRPYKFYNDNPEHETLIKYLDNEQRQPIDYWTRSPSYHDIDQKIKSFYFDQNGDFPEALCTDKHYVAPAFCLGQDLREATVFFSGGGYTFRGAIPGPQSLDYCLPYEEYISGNIKVDKIGDDYPIINEEDIVITTPNGGKFTNYELIRPSTPDGEYFIKIPSFPLTTDLHINIAVKCNDCIVVANPNLETMKVGFTAMDGAPETHLQYSTDGKNFTDYEYHDFDETDDSNTITLSYDGLRKVYFKAGKSDGSGFKNTHFAEVTQSGDDLDLKSTLFFVRNSEGHEHLTTSISGNIMSLLGDGETVPTTIDHSGAFAGLFRSVGGYFSGVGDAGGLDLPARGVSTSEPPTEVIGAYAYMFSTVFLMAPPTVVSFNNFSPDLTTVSHTYYRMFSGCSYLMSMPQVDFTQVVPYMCYHMFDSCYAHLKYGNNTLTGVFATKFAPHCFEGMFYDCHTLAYAPSIGSINEKAAERCCYQMFANCADENGEGLKSASIACSEGADYSFASCFENCHVLTHAVINIATLGSHEHTFDSCFKITVTERGNSLTDLSMPSLQLTSIYWSNTNIFANWLDGQDKRGVLSSTQSVVNAIGGSRGSGFIPESWSLRVIA